VSSLAPAGVSSFHSRGGGRRRARGELRAARLRFVHCGLRTRAGPRRPRPAGKASRRPRSAYSPPNPRLRPTRFRPGRPGDTLAGLALEPRPRPATGGPREEGAQGGPAFPPEEAPGGHIAELSAAAAARLLSGGSGLAPPTLRSFAASHDAPAEPRLSQPAAGREGATHFRGKPCSARSPVPGPGGRSPRRGAEVAARSCRAVAPRPGAWRASQTDSRLAALEAPWSLTAEPRHLPGVSRRAVRRRPGRPVRRAVRVPAAVDWARGSGRRALGGRMERRSHALSQPGDGDREARTSPPASRLKVGVLDY
jgi:hypothetical protein